MRKSDKDNGSKRQIEAFERREGNRERSAIGYIVDLTTVPANRIKLAWRINRRFVIRITLGIIIQIRCTVACRRHLTPHNEVDT